MYFDFDQLQNTTQLSIKITLEQYNRLASAVTAL